jgi:hypothetical protein
VNHRPAPARSGWRALTATGRATGRGPVRLRPLTVGELLDDPFDLLRDSWRTLLLLVGAVVVPVELVLGFLQRTVLGGVGFMELLGDPTAAQVAFAQTDPGAVEAMVAQAFAAVTVFAIVEGLVARVGVSALLGERLTPGEALRATLPRWPALVAAWVLVLGASFGLGLLALGLVAFGGLAFAGVGILLMLVAVPVGLGAYTLLRAVPAVIVVEQLGPLAALRRSAALLRPRFLSVLAVVLLALLVGSLVQTALGALPTAGGFLLGLEAGWVLVAAGAIAAGLVVRPFQALVGALLYVDARVRREGLDLEVRADAGVPAAG